jgi:hypothetical protein
MREIDPYSTPAALLKCVPRETAERHAVYPMRMDADVLVLGAGAAKSKEETEELERTLGRRIRIHEVDPLDVRFAIRRAYNENWEPVPMEQRLGQRLLRRRLVDPQTLQKALDQQKKTNQMLGQILVELKALTQEAVQEALKNP